MITKRTTLLQLQTAAGWRWIFCWVVNQGRIATTEDYRKALPAAFGNLAYFQNRTSAAVRAVKPQDVVS